MFFRILTWIFFMICFPAMTFAGNAFASEIFTVAQDMIEAFNVKDTVKLNHYIHPEFGITVLSNPGAYIAITHYASFTEILNPDEGTGNYALKSRQLNGKITYQKKLPEYNCEKGWSAEGFFLSEHRKNNLASLYKAMTDVHGLEFDESVYNLYVTAGNFISHGLYHTDESTGIYIGRIDGRFYILCIDLITPCDA